MKGNRRSASQNSRCKSRHLYLGNEMDKCDALVVHLSRTLADEPATRRWFYIRYLDDQGFHLRIRNFPGEAPADAADQEFSRIVAEAIGKLHLMPRSDYIPMLETGDPEIRYQSRPRAVSAEYRPETKKYGDGRSLEIAEDLFCASSTLAARIISWEMNGKASRKTLAPVLMSATFDGLVDEGSKAQFFEAYSYFWLGGESYAAADFRSRSTAKADALLQEGIGIAGSNVSLSAEESDCLTAWADALHSAKSSYDELQPPGRVPAESIAFHMSHMMNNRLGINVTEEAHLAVLVERELAMAG